jgi:hypothetical protein
MGGGVLLGPLGTSATELPIVPAPGDYDDGEFDGMTIGRGNQSTRRKPAPAPLCPPQIPLDQTRIRTLGRRCGKPTTNRLSYGAALSLTRSEIIKQKPGNVPGSLRCSYISKFLYVYIQHSTKSSEDVRRSQKYLIFLQFLGLQQ